jgi:hypothetical protein
MAPFGLLGGLLMSLTGGSSSGSACLLWYALRIVSRVDREAEQALTTLPYWRISNHSSNSRSGYSFRERAYYPLALA